MAITSMAPAAGQYKVNNKILSPALKAASTCLGCEIQKCTTTNVYASVLNNIKFFKFMKPQCVTYKLSQKRYHLINVEKFDSND